MPIEFKVAHHLCNVIRRQFQETFPELTLFFIVHGENKRKNALSREKLYISEHPAGQDILNWFDRNSKDLQENRSRFIGMAEGVSHHFAGLIKRRAFGSVIFINHHRFENEDKMKNHVLHLTWHALSLAEDYSRSDKTSLQSDGNGSGFRMTDNFIVPNLSPEQQYHRNLMADIFSSIIQSFEGRQDALRALGMQRIHDTLSAEKGFIAENFALPTCLDTVEFMLDEQIKTLKKRYRTIEQARKMTNDASATFASTVIEQWRAIAQPAQHMAWYGCPQETILGCAIYTSENQNTRSIADMIAEYAHIIPDVITTYDNYNPFVDSATNEDVHLRKALHDFTPLMQKVTLRDDYRIFLKHAVQQNNELLNSNPTGWSAPALYKASETLKSSKETIISPETKSKITADFERDIKGFPWKPIEIFARLAFKRRREGKDMSEETLSRIANGFEEFKEIIDILQKIEYLRQDFEKIDILAEEKAKLIKNITSFISPNAIKT